MKRKQKGFSLLEVLVTMGVMGTGLLAVASFQTNLLTNSGVNKAQTEALSLAQARIEEFRNYTADITSRTEFDTRFVATANPVTDTFTDASGNQTTIVHGSNADFTRQYMIAGNAGESKTVEVTVLWNDRKGEPQHVTLNTELGWESPRASGDLALTDRGPIVPSATGRAHLGEGTLPNGAPTSPNGDGTAIYEDGIGNLKLVLGQNIVLTLEDACQSAGNCIDFVKIKGRVLIDTATTNMNPGAVYVKASDAAFCHRYYATSFDVNGDPLTTDNVTGATTNALLTSNGDYKYFNYTCYIGGGWHGNIGILLDGGISQSDKICLGDPISTNAWEQPQIAARRAYRGMTYKIDNTTASGKEEITVLDANNNPTTLVRYYTIGIGDQVELPVPGSNQKPHDFVVSSMSASDTTGDKCITATNGSNGPLMRTDTTVSGVTGAFFAGNPTDFVCLNSAYVDVFDSAIFGIDTACPYDPTDPPALRHTIGGTVAITGDSALATYVNGVNVVTSDGSGNCAVTAFTYTGGIYTASYTCDIYDWGTGWNGYIEVQPNTSTIACFNSRLSQSNVSQSLSAQDFSCVGGNMVIVSGTVIDAPNNVTLSSAVISDVNGLCTVTGTTYRCRTDIFAGSTWSGSITFTSSGGVICHANGPEAQTSMVSYSNKGPGVYVEDFSITNNAVQCVLH